MFRSFKRRAAERELMDDFASGGPELREALRHLRLLNRIFAAAAPLEYGLQRLWSNAGKPGRLSIVDIGSGSGDVNRHLLKWADENRIELSIMLADVTEEACEEARLLYRGEARVRVVRSDLFELPEGGADVITATQFAHHFAADELPRAVESMLKASRLGVVINDIHRHWIPWAAVWLTTRLLSGNRYILHDGPLSVAKGFCAADWKKLRMQLEDAGWSGPASGMHVAWRPLFRYVAVIEKSRHSANDRSEAR